MAQNTETPQKTLDTATQKNAIPASRLALLGTIVKHDSARALVRLGRNRVKTVTIGDRVAGARIVAIEDGAILLEHLGNSSRLSVPGN